MCGCYRDVHDLVQVGSSRLLGIIRQRWAADVPTDTCDPTKSAFRMKQICFRLPSAKLVAIPSMKVKPQGFEVIDA
jgi:hypothetical protein